LNTNSHGIRYYYADLLEKGLKFAFPPSNSQSATDVLIADLTVALEKLNDPPYTQISAIIKENPTDRIPLQLSSAARSVKRKLKDNDLCVTRADKGNPVVVMKRTEYKTKMKNFIDSNGGKLCTLNFSKFCQNVRKYISNSTYVIEQRSKQFLLNINLSPPRLYGLPKGHKKDIPIRPIVSFLSSPTYKLCQYLDTWFKTNANF